MSSGWNSTKVFVWLREYTLYILSYIRGLMDFSRSDTGKKMICIKTKFCNNKSIHIYTLCLNLVSLNLDADSSSIWENILKLHSLNFEMHSYSGVRKGNWYKGGWILPPSIVSSMPSKSDDSSMKSKSEESVWSFSARIWTMHTRNEWYSKYVFTVIRLQIHILWFSLQ